MNPLLRDKPHWILDAGVVEDEGAVAQQYEWGVTHGNGYRAGWVRVPAGHPWHGKSCRDIKTGVHGGIRFAGPDTESGWWLGFHCAGPGDAADPLLDAGAEWVLGQSVKSTPYVREECRRLIGEAIRVAQTGVRA